MFALYINSLELGLGIVEVDDGVKHPSNHTMI
jgi:hypothetical protein